MYEKNREASALAEIARAIAAGQLVRLHANKEINLTLSKVVNITPTAYCVFPLQQNNAPSTKPSQPTRLEHQHKVAPLKKSAPPEANAHLEPQTNNNNNKKKSSENIKSQRQQEGDEIEPPLPSPPPPQQLLPSTSDAFHDWYLSTLADNFESEIEGLGNDVGSKVLIQALESNLGLFSAEEMKVALATAGIPTATD